MKKAVYLMIVLSTILTSCGSEPDLVGTWQLDSVSGEELTESEKKMKLTFKENGECQSDREGEVELGVWERSEDGKTVTMTIKGREVVMEGVEIAEEKLTFVDNDDKVTLKRLN